MRYTIIFYIFILVHTNLQGQVFSEVQKIVAGDRELHARFGNAVAISGQYAVISAYQMGQKNYVYIFQKNVSGQWIQIQKIASPDHTYNSFGYSVDISEDQIIIGDWSNYNVNPSINTGAAYVYKRDNNNIWRFQQKLLASDGKKNDFYGYSVSIYKNTCVVGANQTDTGGAVYVYEKDSSGSWIETKKLLPSGNSNQGDFGTSVTIHNDVIVVGAPYENFDETGNNLIYDSGRVYVYEKSSGSDWIETQKIAAFDRQFKGYFGSSISLEHNKLIIGSGSRNSYLINTYAQTCGAYIYEKNSSGIWEFKQKLSPPDPNDHLGFSNSVGISGNYAVVAAFDERLDNDGNILDRYSGAAYIYKRQPDGIWNMIQRIVSSDLASGDYFGRFAAIEGNTIMVGAYQEDEDENGENTIESTGSAYIFEVSPPDLDTTPCVQKCYNYTSFIPSTFPIEVEKKLESTSNASIISIPLIYDINNDGKPEILTPVVDLQNSKYSNSIQIINSENGNIIKTLYTPYFYNSTSATYLIANIFNNCIHNIIILCTGNELNSDIYRNRLICLNFNGDILWISNEVVNVNSLYDSSKYNYGSISIADFNLDGIPELYIFNEIFNAQTGVKLLEGENLGRGIGKTGGNGLIGVSIAANLDDSPELELAAGYTVYKVNINNPNGRAGNTMTAINLDFNGHFVDGFTTVADINMDGRLDVIVLTEGKYVVNDSVDVGIYCYTIINGQAVLLSNIGRGAILTQWFGSGYPTILYNQLTNKIEIVVSLNKGLGELISFSYNGSLTFEINWEFAIKDGGAFTGITAFDINGDGLAELVHRDEQFLRILKLTTTVPEEIFKTPCISITATEYPVIADIDGKGQAKICVICASNFFNFHGNLNVFGAPDGQYWAPARKIWHQYAYNPLFINDDGTVPQYQENHATYKNGRYNNFLMQESLIDENGNVPVPAASLNGQIRCLNYDINTNLYSITFDISNKDEASDTADSNTPISFYDGNPEAEGIYLGTYNTTQEITPGSSLSNLKFQINAPITGPLWMVINTDKNSIVLADSSQYHIPECDYTDNVFVIHDIPRVNLTSVEICEGDTYLFFGQVLTSSGQYLYEVKSQTGCDSIINIVDLTTTNTKNSEHTHTDCDSYIWNGTTYDQSGIYIYQTISTNGCDSIATLDLTVHRRTQSSTVLASCDTYDWNGQTYTQGGMYTFQTQNVHGCDSTATLLLTISPSYLDTSFVTTCDAYTWSGSSYNQSGTYTWSGQTASGCDSILTLVLNLQNTIETEENITACDSYEWNGNTYTSSGLYTHQTISSLGCDSIVTLYLEVFPTVVVEENLTACDTLVWNGQTFIESGFYSHQSQTFNGCDSITQLFLTILPSSVTNLSVEACESYTWNEQTYQNSGSYTFQSSNHLGCDSTVVLDLTIHHNNTSSTEISACDQYEWNGNSYTQSGSYDFSSLNQYGCDSTALLELTIHPSYEVPLSLSDCVSVDYFGNSYIESGMYPITLQSQFGCDSIVRLEVRILSESYEDIQSSCDSFYWPVNDQYYDQSGIYQQTFTNTDGCDSTFSLTLEINPSYKETENITTCDTYQWNVNQNTYTESGLYEYRTQTNKGCDSLRLLQLNIEKSFAQRDTITTTTTYQWPLNNQDYEESGNYELRFTSINGCDSLYFLVLRINQDFEVLFPNIISSQGTNGKFKGYSQHPQILLKKLSIFDRMASRVYHVENVLVQDENYGWDGRFGGELVMEGVYAWIAEVVLPDGSVKQMVGDVTVIR